MVDLSLARIGGGIVGLLANPLTN